MEEEQTGMGTETVQQPGMAGLQLVEYCEESINNSLLLDLNVDTSIDATNIDGIVCRKNYFNIFNYTGLELSDEYFTLFSKGMKTLKFGERVFFFDASGNPPAAYDFLNWQVTPAGTFQQVNVGKFDSANPLGQQLSLNVKQIVWNGGGEQIPVSVCSESCHPGYKQIKQQGRPVCCFDCVPCSEGTIANLSDSVECLKCPDEEWHNEQRDYCIMKPVEFLSFEEPLGMALTSITIVSALLPAVILIVFIKHRETPIVKANNRDISYTLLLALILCALCSFIFIGRPSKITCMLRQQTFAVAFALCISCVLAKTTMVVIAFNATKPNSSLRKYVGPTLPNIIVLVCTLVQVTICVTWLQTLTPFVERNMKSQPGKVILQCNEGSVIAFWCILGYMGILASISFLLAFLSRNLPDSFNEAKYITFSMIVFGSVWLSFIPAYLSTAGKYMIAVELFAILSSSTGMLACIFIPKCHIILLRPEMNSKEYLIGKGSVNKTIKVF
ncbi:vomeronasal type-2 receptor 26-like [Protopterus annectens]|uniref:vomeronasal type-2 receptor 26-like n=1 Tax=Protopterus annectens TaxID=7888 RepID=UPI001CFAA130|nr:vomeronasal type-2 receptor 26-like [Protopterus annectens]